MTTIKTIALVIIGVIVSVLFSGAVTQNAVESNLGGVYNQVTKYFTDGVLVVSKTTGIGYAVGSGCAVTQATSRATGVTCTGMSGAVTTDATSLAAGAEAEFTVTNTSVAVGDTVLVTLRSGATANTSVPLVTTVANGSFKIQLTNLHAATADTGASIINFVIIKAVSS